MSAKLTDDEIIAWKDYMHGLVVLPGEQDNFYHHGVAIATEFLTARRELASLKRELADNQKYTLTLEKDLAAHRTAYQAMQEEQGYRDGDVLEGVERAIEAYDAALAAARKGE